MSWDEWRKRTIVVDAECMERHKPFDPIDESAVARLICQEPVFRDPPEKELTMIREWAQKTFWSELTEEVLVPGCLYEHRQASVALG